MLSILIGNICSILAMGTDCLSATRKKANEVLWIQALSQFIYFIGSVVLKGYSAAAQSAVSVVRNIAATGKNTPKFMEWMFVMLGVVLGIACNNRGFYGWLPIIANLEYSIAVFRFKDNERALKTAFAVSVLLFAAFNVVLLNFVGLVTNAVVFVSTVSFVISSGKSEKAAVKRIKKMEAYFDALQADPHCKNADKMLKALREYSDSGLWLYDFEMDENGKLPKELKRGVLSEDGLYNLLCELKQE